MSKMQSHNNVNGYSSTVLRLLDIPPTHAHHRSLSVCPHGFALNSGDLRRTFADDDEACCFESIPVRVRKHNQH